MKEQIRGDLDITPEELQVAAAARIDKNRASLRIAWEKYMARKCAEDLVG